MMYKLAKVQSIYQASHKCINGEAKFGDNRGHFRMRQFAVEQ